MRGILIGILALSPVNGLHQIIFGALNFRFLDGCGQRIGRFQPGIEQSPDRSVTGGISPLAEPVAKFADRLAQITVQQTNRVLSVGDAPVQFIENVLFQPALPLAFSVGGKLADFSNSTASRTRRRADQPSLLSSSIVNSPCIRDGGGSLVVTDCSQLLLVLHFAAPEPRRRFVRLGRTHRPRGKAFPPFRKPVRIDRGAPRAGVKDPAEPSAKFDAATFDIESGSLNFFFGECDGFVVRLGAQAESSLDFSKLPTVRSSDVF